MHYIQIIEILKINIYSKACVKWLLKKDLTKVLYDKCQLNEGREYCRILPLEHSAILLTFIKP